LRLARAAVEGEISCPCSARGRRCPSRSEVPPAPWKKGGTESAHPCMLSRKAQRETREGRWVAAAKGVVFMLRTRRMSVHEASMAKAHAGGGKAAGGVRDATVRFRREGGEPAQPGAAGRLQLHSPRPKRFAGP